MRFLFVLLQRVLPHHLLSRFVGYVAKSEKRWIKGPFIAVFSFFFKIDLDEAERSNAAEYKTFNDFFTRSLKPGARPVAGTVCSPADGTVAAFGNITDGTLIQSKGIQYSLDKIIADDGAPFRNGSFITVYLAPHNYHRVHTPVAAKLHRTTYVPGKLFSVNGIMAEYQQDLLADNERLVMRFATEKGPMAYVMVGAALVAGIKPVWSDRAYRPRMEVKTEMRQQFGQGEELGQFEMGSTVVLIFDHPIDFCVAEGDKVKVGEKLA